MRHTTFFLTLAALGVFVGVTAGSARAEGPQAEPPARLKGIYAGVGAGIGDADDVGWAWRFMAWYRPYDWIAGEIGYADVDNGGHGDFDGLHVAVEPTIPIRPANLDILVKIGGFFNEDNHFAGGLGLAYHLPKGFGLRLDWDRLNMEEGDGVDIVTLALFYHLATPPGK